MKREMKKNLRKQHTVYHIICFCLKTTGTLQARCGERSPSFSAVCHFTGDIAAENGQAWANGCSETFEALGSGQREEQHHEPLFFPPQSRKTHTSHWANQHGAARAGASPEHHTVKSFENYKISGNFITFK